MSKKRNGVAVYAPGPMNVKCHAHKKDGTPCGRWSLKGSTVCTSHGAGTKAARAKAQLRLLMAADPAAAEMVAIMLDPKSPPNVRLSAAAQILDRAGLSAKQVVEVDAQEPWLVLLSKIVVPAGAYDADVLDVDYTEETEPTSRAHATCDDSPVDLPPAVAPSGQRTQPANLDDTPPRHLDPDNHAGRYTGRANFTR